DASSAPVSAGSRRARRGAVGTSGIAAAGVATAPTGPRRSRTTTSGAPSARSRRTVTPPAPASTEGRSRATAVHARSSRPRGPALEQEARDRGAQHVGGDPGPEAGARRGWADDDPERLTREPPSARVHEEPTAVAPTRVERPHLPEVTRDPGGGLGADWHEPL